MLARNSKRRPSLRVAVYIYKHSKFIFQSFRKIQNKILGIANDKYYKLARSQYKILCILDYIKIIKSEIFIVNSAYFNTYNLPQFSFLYSIE
jgi:hypothetical protein